MEVKVTVTNEEETKALGQWLGEHLEPQTTIVLSGDLGTGKTTFSKGIARGLGIEQMIKSPTYTLIREYEEGRLPLYHMDIYRLSEGASDLGLDEYFDSDGVSLVEWGDMVEEELPPQRFKITLQRLGDTERLFTFEAIQTTSPWFETLKKEMEK